MSVSWPYRHLTQTAAAGLASQKIQLLVGVLSFRSSQNLARRSAIRALCATGGMSVLRFIMSGVDTAEQAFGDVLVFQVPRDDRQTGTFLLSLAFLSWAARLQGVEYIARADDDAAFNASGIALELSRMPQWLRRFGPRLVYGPFGEWFMWNISKFAPACWARAHLRWARARARSQDRTSREGVDGKLCLGMDLAGPFPFAKGPFVAYSRTLLEELAGSFTPDEALKALKVPHSSKAILYDDVYLAYLIYKQHRNANLTLISAPMSEYVKEREPHVRPAVILHKLKHPMRFLWVANRSAILFRRHWGKLICSPLGSDTRPRDLEVLRGHCCRNWTFCTYFGHHYRVYDRGR
mmetsp:Transcript_49981/g.82876  ORF Transcript_49981/g.82876 Transcript_49981/m.82876 type:complete len:351 (-) Transcript_49981:160-1212(-)